MIWELRHAFTIKLLLEVSGLARSTYYYYIKHRNDEDKYSEIKEQITNIFCENKERYGYRRITMELHNRGYRINHKAVLRLMNEEKIKCRVRIKKYHSYKGEVGKVAPNLLERNFSTTAPNEKWVTDVTEFSLFGQKLYLSPILDLHSSDIVSYTISDRPVLSMVIDMARQALAVGARGGPPRGPKPPPAEVRYACSAGFVPQDRQYSQLACGHVWKINNHGCAIAHHELRLAKTRARACRVTV